MPNAQAMTGMGAGAEAALAEAIERVFVALGVGSAVILLLLALVLAGEAVNRRLPWRRRPRPGSRTPDPLG
jgi:hypothetical protein